MDYRIIHRTTYEYTEPVSVSHHAACLEPRATDAQQCTSFGLEISPTPDVTKVRTDYFGNRLCMFSVQALHQRLRVTARSQVSVIPRTPPVPALSPVWQEVQTRFRDPVSPKDVDPYEFCLDSPLLVSAPFLADYARLSFPDFTPLLVGARHLTERIYRDFKYDPKATSVATPLAKVWEKKRGVCQDFAHLAIAGLRSLGLSARYVSGYLRTHPPAGKPRLIGADASHAWFSVYCPHNGWVDFDPTNNVLPGDEHITVAVGRDFSDVSPLSGILTGGGEHELKVSVDVEPLG
jgi:transglutaminase-like putative cysteine protease